MISNDFNAPFYWVYAFMFLGLALTTSAFFKRTTEGHLQVLWWMATLGMSLASMGYALLPWLGRAVLGLTSMAIMASVALLYLIARAWRTPLTRQLVMTLGLLLLAALLVTNALLHFSTHKLRILSLIFPSALILVWGVYEGWMLGRWRPSVSQKILLVTQVVMLLVVVTWQTWAVLNSPSTPAVAQAGDPLYVAVGRLLVVSLTLVLMVSMVGLAMEQMRSDKERLLEDKLQADALNKKMAWTLQERNQMLKALTFSPEARNAHALVSNLAHEMNQPLGSIRLYVDHLLHSPDLPLEEKEDVLRKIVLGTERAQQSLRDFRLFFSTSQQEDQEIRLDALTREIIDTFSGELHEAGIELTLDIQAPVSVDADAVQMKMVVLNLLTNAMDALRDHAGPRRLGIRLWREQGLAFFSIQDSGPGVPIALRDKLFTSYFSTKEFGVGLGLWLCRAIVEYHGGAMNASLDEPGARFHFNMPLAAEKDRI